MTLRVVRGPENEAGWQLNEEVLSQLI